MHYPLNSKPLPNLAGCPAPPFKLVFWLQIHISRQDCCKIFGHRFFQRIPQLNPMLNKWKSSWSRLLGQGSLKLHQQFCLAPIVGSYFHDLSISSNDCDHLVFLTLYAWLILSFFLFYIGFLCHFSLKKSLMGGWLIIKVATGPPATPCTSCRSAMNPRQTAGTQTNFASFV